MHRAMHTHGSLTGLGTVHGSAACQEHEADNISSHDGGYQMDRAQLLHTGLPQIGMNMP